MAKRAASAMSAWPGTPQEVDPEADGKNDGGRVEKCRFLSDRPMGL